MPLSRYILLLCCLLIFGVANAQDIDLNLSKTFLPGHNVIKIKRDFSDPYLWALTDNHEVYRVNTNTFVVDDYSAKLSAYAGQQWIDIAGAGPEHVFIAFNTASVLEYDNGSVNILGSNIGINGVVNSIGFDEISAFLTYQTNSLGIATANGLIYYNIETKTTRPAQFNLPSRIFDASYRSYMFHDGAFPKYDENTITHYSMFEHSDYTIYGEDILLGGIYGTDLRCAYYTRGSMWYAIGFSFTTYSNTFYGTEKGLIQLAWYNNFSSSPYKKYLTGEHINKISSVFGLPGFTYNGETSMSLGRENLLVGTDAGLYFSDSKYMANNQSTLSDYTFFHFDGLSTKKINDITPNSNSEEVASRVSALACENGIWVAAIDGLYLLTTSYAGHIDQPVKLSAIYFDSPNNQKSELQTCGSVNTKINFYYGYSLSNSIIKWLKDGQEIPGGNGTTLNVTQPGEYYAIIHDVCSGLDAETNHLKVTQLAGPVFTFNYPDKLNYCFGSNATLQTENNVNYQYRWYKDGILNGNTTAVLNTTLPGKYKLEISACSGSWTPTKEVEIAFVKVPQPTITPDKAAYCAGSTAVLTADVLLDATGIVNWQPYQYRWYKDGILLSPTPASSLLSITQPGKYTVEVSSCFGNSSTSAPFEFNPITLTIPKIIPDKAAYCIGSIATLSTDFVNDGSYVIDWLRNGTVMPLEQNRTAINTNVAANYTIRISSKLTSCSQSSNSYNLSFEAPPSISIQRIVNTALCDGQTVDLKATYSSGTVRWSTGETTDKISVKTSGIYTATVKTVGGCEVPEQTDVEFFNNPVLSVPDATLCQFTNDELTLTAPAGFVKYEWNGQQGSSAYTTNKLGAVTLTVTDQNGCQATQTIHITSHCNDIHIPNTFTPNGDGLNDKWIISGLEGDITVNVKVYNRGGGLIFQSQGYDVPWDGSYHGKKVPAGVYYYVINAKGTKQILSGSLTIIY